ncbi:MAG: Cys-tRNA(Pro) deacylase [Eubacteriales bacterium]|nr:Cys-tRNA(Pro) deacylase [Eubacteriales bacterium]
MPKTNAMRILTQAKIVYELQTYEVDENDLSGTKVAAQIGMPVEQVYKTLVAHGEQTGYLVCLIPVDREIDLKKLAQVSANKRVELIPTKDLLTVTGYVRGGCSPFGMKKKFPTYIESASSMQNQLAVSAGVRGCQIVITPQALIDFTQASVVEVCGR